MTADSDRDKISQLHTAVFGVEGQGGIVRQVDEMNKKLSAVERRLDTWTVKLLLLIFLAATLGSSASAAVQKLIGSLGIP